MEADAIPTTDTTVDPSVRSRRAVCVHCQRPVSTCLCPALPAERLTLSHVVHVVVLQHPHEASLKNASLALVQYCLDPSCLTVLVGRRLPPPFVAASVERDDASSEGTALDHYLHNPHRPVWLLFPGSDAVDVSLALERHTHRNHAEGTKAMTLLVLDGTWKYAREMDRANVQHGCYPPHLTRVQLSSPSTSSHLWPPFCPRRFDIRSPPSDEHLSTAEAMAMALSLIDHGLMRGTHDDPARQETESDGHGVTNTVEDVNRPTVHEDKTTHNYHVIYTTIMKPLDLMVQQWHGFEDKKRKLSQRGDDQQRHRTKGNNAS